MAVKFTNVCELAYNRITVELKLKSTDVTLTKSVTYNRITVELKCYQSGILFATLRLIIVSQWN